MNLIVCTECAGSLIECAECGTSLFNYTEFDVVLFFHNGDKEKAAAEWAYLALEKGVEFDEVIRELQQNLRSEKYDYLAIDAIAKDALREVERHRR
jgi:hypothetical protein